MEVSSEEELRKKLRESLEAQAERGEKERLKTEIIDKLLKSTTMDLP